MKRIKYQIMKNKLVDLICASGANIRHMQKITSEKYVSKTEMRRALKKQSKYLEDMQSQIKTYNKY